MKKLASIFLSLCLVSSFANSAFAWGPDGHKTVGNIASMRINSHTRNKIREILKPQETLGGIANWADSVKTRMGQHDSDTDTDAFLQDNHNNGNGNWHFDDLPLGCGSYDTCNGFTPDDDVVHLINACIRALQNNPDPDHPLSRRNALRMLVHLVGDLHQPLHVGSGYINENGPNNTIVIVRDPNSVSSSTPSDRGANALIIDGREKNLHSFWDGDLVHLLRSQKHQPNASALAQFLKNTVTPKPEWNALGPIETWASQWATDSLKVSVTETFATVRITRKRVVTATSHGQRITKTVYDIRRGNNYNNNNVPVVRNQLAKGGFRLAKLLDAIFANQ